MTHTLGELAEQLGLAFSGDAQRSLHRMAPLATAAEGDLSFLSNSRFLTALAATRAGAVILHPEHAAHCPVDCLLADDPYVSFARATALFDDTPAPATGVHASATVAADVLLGEGVSVGANAVVEAGVTLGAGVVIGSGVYVGHHCIVGDGSRINPNAALYHNVHLGRSCVVHANAVIGADGFGFAPVAGGWEKIHQLGGVRIGDRVEIGACSTIDRGALDPTVLEDGVIVDNLVQIAHNCHIGKNTAIAGCTGLAGSTIIGANCTLAGGVGVVGHVEICDNVHVTCMTMVTKSITEPGSYSSGTPMSGTRQWKRNAVRFSQLEAIQARLASVEKQQQS